MLRKRFELIAVALGVLGASLATAEFLGYGIGASAVTLFTGLVSVATAIMVWRISSLERDLQSEFMVLTREQQELTSILARDRGLIRDLEGTYPNLALAYSAFAVSVRKADGFVNLLGPTLNAVIRDSDLMVALTEAVRRGVKVRILLLDPDVAADEFIDRARSEIQNGHDLQRWFAWYETVSGGVEMRFSATPIQVALLLTDEDAILTPMLPTRSPLDLFSFRVVAKGKGMHRYLRSLFEDCWFESRPALPVRT